MNATSHGTPSETTHRNDDVVARLRSSEIFRDYQQAFQTATGLPLVLRAAGSFLAPMAGARNLNPLCALMAAKNKTCSACLQMQEQAEAAACSGAATTVCFAGLSESLVPIRIGLNVVAYLHTGQIADLGFANFRGAGDYAYRLIKFRLLLAVQLFDCALESRGDE
jgi:hypothetical protein